MFSYKYFNTRLLRHLLMLFTCMVSIDVLAASGGLSLGQTRMIFHGDRPSMKLTLNNQSSSVYLISASVQKNPEVSDAKETLPFLVTPPLFRLEAGNSNSVLIMRGDTSRLPKDRESIFYLSFLAIPPASVNEDKNDASLQPRLSVGLRTIIKLFYRPDKLKVSADLAAEQLEFTQWSGSLHVNNPTPYYLTLATLNVNGSPVNLREQRNMIPPFASVDYEHHGNASKVSWSVINDYGSESKVYHSAAFNKEHQ